MIRFVFPGDRGSEAALQVAVLMSDVLQGLAGLLLEQPDPDGRQVLTLKNAFPDGSGVRVTIERTPKGG